jgi:heme/copper-type cytochrome/quinol oxidase subunit 3
MSHAMTLPAESSRRRVDVALGMAIFIGSWSMAFLSLFLSFLIIRNRQPAWPPAGVTLPSLPVAAAGTAVLLASSVAVAAAMRRLRAGAPGFASRWAAATALALGFAALQTWLWIGVWSVGETPDTSIYQGLFYLLTWFHAAHVACGLIALLWIQWAAAAGRVTAERRSTAAGVATFWHFVDVVWLVLFVGFFLV